MINAGPATKVDVINEKISDHYPIISDGIICWNIWAPGTRNGFDLVVQERAAIKADPTLKDPQNIVKIRLDKTIDHLIALIKELGNDNIDAICLQEVPDNDKIHIY